MKPIPTAACGILAALVIAFPDSGRARSGQSLAEEKPLFEREFAARFNSISIENTENRTEIQGLSGGRLRVEVMRRSGAGGKPAGVPLVSFDDTAPGTLKISVGPPHRASLKAPALSSA